MDGDGVEVDAEVEGSGIPIQLGLMEPWGMRDWLVIESAEVELIGFFELT